MNSTRSDTIPLTDEPEISRTDAEERTKRRIAIIISLVAILGALLAFARTDASAHADDAKRLQKRLTIEASGLKLGSQSELGFNLAAAQAWLEMAKLTNSAEMAGALTLPNWENYSYQQREWPTEVATVVPDEWYRPARDRLEEVAPLLQPPYSGNVRQFYADKSLVTVIMLTEEATDARAQQNQWAEKASSYSFYLAMLAIGGALLGLSTTMQGRGRLICFVTGVGIAGIVAVLSVSVYTRGVTYFSESAINDYAQGVGLSYQGQSADVTLADDLTRQAINSFDRAIEEEPAYANAMFDRANALYKLKEYQSAAESYQLAIDSGRNDTGAIWNLGWNLYLLGQFDEANDAYRQALSLNPDQITVRMNLALSLLAGGSIDEATAEYQDALERAERQVRSSRAGGPQVPYSFWKQVDRSALDLDALDAQLNGSPEDWMEAPPKNTLPTREGLRNGITSLSTHVREANVALEYDGSLPVASKSAGSVSSFKYSAPGGRGPDASYPSTPFEAGMVIDLSAKSLMPPAPGSSNTVTSTFPASFDQD